MRHRGRGDDQRRSPGTQRVYGTLRSTLIGYGVGAYALFHLGPWSDAATQAGGGWASSRGMLLAGIGVQFLVIAARAFIRRRVSDPDAAARVMVVVELLADGATVLLFALATFGAINHALNEF